MLSVLQLVLLGLISNVLKAESEEVLLSAPASLRNEVRALKDQLREESLSLREEMYSIFGNDRSGLLLLQVIDLIKEVKEMQGQIIGQAEKIESIESKLVESMESLERMGESQGVKMTEVESLVTAVNSKVETMRSEVRLISQQKLTWQNSTWNDRLFSEYTVDGVYTLSTDWNALNPISHPHGSAQRNNVIIIDLGGLFKIRTVKVWSRLDCCLSHNVGVFIYADDELIGGIAEEKPLYNFDVNQHVYARKIYVKQPLAKNLNFREIQVYGSGPYDESEI